MILKQLIPLKVTDLDGLATLLARAERLASRCDVAADDAALAEFGDVDPTDWSASAVEALTRKSEALRLSTTVTLDATKDAKLVSSKNRQTARSVEHMRPVRD